MRMSGSEVISWNIRIDGLTSHGYGRVAYELSPEVRPKGVNQLKSCFTELGANAEKAWKLDERR
jgi:hypothetical protein